MNEQHIINQLKSLTNVTAPDSLRKNILLQSSQLIKEQRISSSYFSLSTLRIALCLALLLVLSSTVTVAALKSEPGDFLFALKKPIEKLAGIETETGKNESLIAEPTPEASPSLIPESTPPSETRVYLPVGTVIPSPTLSPTPLPAVSTQVEVILPTPSASPNSITVDTPILGIEITLGNTPPQPEATPEPTNKPLLDLPIKIKIGL